MQDRYAGDVGDFGKFGMLRCIENTGIGYLEDDKYRGCDDAGGTALSVGTGCVCTGALGVCILAGYRERVVCIL